MASYYYLDNFTWAALTLETEKGINRREGFQETTIT